MPKLTQQDVDRYRSIAWSTAPSNLPAATITAMADLVTFHETANRLEGQARRAGKSLDPGDLERVRKARDLAQRTHDHLCGTEPGVAAQGWHPGGQFGPDHAAGGGGYERASDSPRILTKGERVADLYPGVTADHGYAVLGALVKQGLGVSRPGETQRVLGEEFKDVTLSSGGAVVPAPVSSTVIDLLRARTVVTQLGARTVPMESATLKLPRLTGDPAAAWQAEAAAYSEDDPELDSVTLTPKRLGALVKLSDEVSEDSDPALVGDVLAQSLAASFAVELDRAALTGSGSSNEPVGVANQSSILTKTSAGDPNWALLVAGRVALLGANSDCSGFVLNPATLSTVEDTAASDGHFVAPPASLANVPRLATSAVPVDLGTGSDETEVFAGRWSDLLVGVRVGLEVRVLNELYAASGQVGVRARLRADVQVAHPKSFWLATGVST